MKELGTENLESYKPSDEEIDFQIGIIRREKARRYKFVSADDVKITEADKVIAVQRAISDKKTSEYWKKVDAEVREVKKLTAEEYFSVFSSRYKVDSENEKVVKLLCLYFSEDARFEKNGLSLNKGILLFGNVGCGKTTLMQFFSQNTRQGYGVTSCRDVSYNFASNGFEAISEYSGHVKCFDDLGTDEERKHYGDKVNAMTEVILNRYDKNSLTHLTTNLIAEEIKNIYGQRVSSRLREMCNLIEFNINAKDRRK